MSHRFPGEALLERGFTDLVSVIPPNAQLTPTSKIDPAQIGKIPGRVLPSGLWAGYDWRAHQATIEDVRGWSVAGANIGLRAARFPAVDIDTTNVSLANIIAQRAVEFLGPAPRRTGRAPKVLLQYRAEEPFGKMALAFEFDGTRHLVEVLAQGQQYLVHGIHPATMKPYTWDMEPRPERLVAITRDKVDTFLTDVAAVLEMLGAQHVRRLGNGNLAGASPDQQSLRAPSLEALRDAMAHIPNTQAVAPGWEEYIRVGYALKAAAGPEGEDEALSLWIDWALQDELTRSDAETAIADWRRMTGDKKVGWNYLAELAHRHGFDSAKYDFEVVDATPVTARTSTDLPLPAPLYSEQWLADEVVSRARDRLRFAPQLNAWVVWDGTVWRRDAVLLAEDVIKRELRTIAVEVAHRVSPGDEKAQRQMTEKAITFCSARMAAAVEKLVRSDRSIAISATALDHDPWTLNTPGGLVDLKTGDVRPNDSDALCSRMTAVPPDFGGKPVQFLRFLDQVFRGEQPVIDYVQRLAGYALTGITREQKFVFFWGPGGNGKGTLWNLFQHILDSYATTAPFETFMSSHSDRHPTDLAGLAGARLVVASEVKQGRAWDTQKLKSVTGDDVISARFMQRDFFTFKPSFKLVFLGNDRPAIHGVDRAMRRRTHLVPMTFVAEEVGLVDQELDVKLRAEAPAILAWMIRGCLLWQEQQLAAPPSIVAETEEYLAEEDDIGQWLAECTERAPETFTGTAELFRCWQEWANARERFVGTDKRIAGMLRSRGFEKSLHPQTRRNGFKGLTIRTRTTSLDYGT